MTRLGTSFWWLTQGQQDWSAGLPRPVLSHIPVHRVCLWREEGRGSGAVTIHRQGGTFLPQALLGAEVRRGVRAASRFIQRQMMASKLLHIRLSLLQILPCPCLPANLHQMPTFSPSPSPFPYLHPLFFLNPTFSPLCSDCEHQRARAA